MMRHSASTSSRRVNSVASPRIESSRLPNTGVGENNIDLPLRLSYGVVKTTKVGQLGNVSPNSRHVGADCLHGIVELLLPTARDEDIGTFLDEKLCGS